MPKTKNSKQRILEVTAKLFYKNGYQATSVDTIARAVGVTKATLYHHFSDKEELIEATLNYMSQYYRNSYIQAWNRKGLQLTQKLTILFNEMEAFFKEEDCYGCPFINAAGEYTDRSSMARRICEAHYQFLVSNLEQFACDAKLSKPRLVAEQIASVISGSYTGWFVAGIKDAAKQGKLVAEMIIAAHQKT